MPVQTMASLAPAVATCAASGHGRLAVFVKAQQSLFASWQQHQLRRYHKHRITKICSKLRTSAMSSRSKAHHDICVSTCR